MFSTYLERWRLDPDGASMETPHSWLLPVRQLDSPAMLKVRKPASDETATSLMLAYYAGDGAVRLLACSGDAVLMERVCGTRSLVVMATDGADDAAAGILADVVARLHQQREVEVPQGLLPLQGYFQSLFQRRNETPVLAAAADVADALLDHPRDEGVLHGDLHHDNVVFDAVRGWLAIDPKGLWGECAYDVANLLRNPQYHAAVVHDSDRMR